MVQQKSIPESFFATFLVIARNFEAKFYGLFPVYNHVTKPNSNLLSATTTKSLDYL